jgi:hypothetical protein
MRSTVSVVTYRDDPLYPRVQRAVAAILDNGKVVAPVDVLVGLGLLAPEKLDDWRHGRIPYLEQIVDCNVVLDRIRNAEQGLAFENAGVVLQLFVELPGPRQKGVFVDDADEDFGRTTALQAGKHLLCYLQGGELRAAVTIAQVRNRKHFWQWIHQADLGYKNESNKARAVPAPAERSIYLFLMNPAW